MPQTTSQLLRIADVLPADGSETVFTFPDGWTVRHLLAYGDEHREGTLMCHCWSHRHDIDAGVAGDNAAAHAEYFAIDLAAGDQWDDTPRTYLYSLRDQNNLPRVSFFFERENDLWNAEKERYEPSSRLHLHEALGHASTVPSQELRDRLVEFAAAQPQPVIYTARYHDRQTQTVGTVTLMNANVYQDTIANAERSQLWDKLETAETDAEYLAILRRWENAGGPGKAVQLAQGQRLLIGALAGAGL